MDNHLLSEALNRHLSYLDQDPDNLSLLMASLDIAMSDGAFDLALDLLERCDHLDPGRPEVEARRAFLNLAGGRFEDAANQYATLASRFPHDAKLKLHLAHCLAQLGRYAEVSAGLDATIVAAIPEAATLKLRALHYQGAFDDGLALGHQLIAAGSTDPALLGAISVLALDGDAFDLAAAAATRSPTSDESRAVLGFLDLQDGDLPAAAKHFSAALSLNANSARAALGQGLLLVAQGQPGEAAPWLDRASVLFGSHLGSYIAAGWAWYLSGDLTKARERFATAEALDDNFAESHGGLALLDFQAGDLVNARRRAEIALRLDRRSYAGALARSLILQHDGDAAASDHLRSSVMNAPLTADGLSLMSFLTRFKPGQRSRSSEPDS